MNAVNTAKRAGRIPSGLLYKTERPTLDQRMAELVERVGGHKDYDLKKIIAETEPAPDPDGKLLLPVPQRSLRRRLAESWNPSPPPKKNGGLGTDPFPLWPSVSPTSRRVVPCPLVSYPHPSTKLGRPVGQAAELEAGQRKGDPLSPPGPGGKKQWQEMFDRRVIFSGQGGFGLPIQ